jgi:hypothetical protein
MVMNNYPHARFLNQTFQTDKRRLQQLRMKLMLPDMSTQPSSSAMQMVWLSKPRLLKQLGKPPDSSSAAM